jgi:benzoyl-CoA reductase/2-hydroxyglutaryl-CoA dehydratase subunit BcrC/BadD/HgdB
VFPAQYPREILWAMDVLPVEIWDPPIEVSHANAHLQTYICSVVKSGLELILQGRCDDLDGFLFPHTCDSIQNLASIVYDYLGLNKPCYFFYHPKAPYKDSSRKYYFDQLKALVSRLEKQLGPLEISKLTRCVEQGRRVAERMRELYALRARGQLVTTNAAFYRVIRLGEYLHPDDFLPILEGFLSESKGEAPDGLKVILSGVLPNPPEILSLLDRMGVRVADDDMLCCGRRLLSPSLGQEDPFRTLTDTYFAMPPCSTRDSPLDERLNYLLDKVKQSGAKGVIFYMVKFCEPELFDVPLLVEGLKEKGIATLVVDVELNRGFSGQLATRVEAFVEMIG